ncbi:hypothetical protein [Campylobacter hyointestinalis]|uniref:hypothetical protein n=1 Tax=Campylobacter hyointestinalis TaxID=198 RepID=UPI000DCCF104|nr:hypothetical protein [Campylobacter hyointestinalis]RAZ38518.1 hypothetical protein CHL9426_05890 [Campylobacter hyointestinalis subsp. lawsonii]RAZ52255.1 hypothetical protein CHL10075_03735 [Campylobacter hyointestinalis subsp. lawsonii]
MTNEKLQLLSIAKFTQIYCCDHHKAQPKNSSKLDIVYKGVNLFIKYNLYKECKFCMQTKDCKTANTNKNQNLENACYDKNELKYVVKIMKSSRMKLGKLKSFFIKS